MRTSRIEKGATLVTRTFVDTNKIARRFDSVAHDVAGVRELRAAQSEGMLEFWLIVDDISPDDERRLYQVGVDIMAEYPDVNIHILNSRYFDPDMNLATLIPANAESLVLQ